MTMLAHAVLSANEKLEKRRLLKYVKKHNLQWALDEKEYMDYVPDASLVAACDPKVLKGFEERYEIAQASSRLFSNLLEVERYMGNMRLPIIEIDPSDECWGLDRATVTKFCTKEPKPYAYEVMLGRFVYTYGLIQPLHAVIHVVGGLVYIACKVKGKIAETRREKKWEKIQARKAEEKAANEARQKKLAEWKKVEAYNNEIQSVDNALAIVNNAVRIKYARPNKDRRIVKLAFNAKTWYELELGLVHQNVYVYLPDDATGKTIDFVWRGDEEERVQYINIASEIGKSQIETAIQKKHDDIESAIQKEKDEIKATKLKPQRKFNVAEKFYARRQFGK